MKNTAENINATHKSPIIDGKKVTFICEGNTQPILAGDFNNWDFKNGVCFERGSDKLWKADLEFPLDTYMEYAFHINGKRVSDPFNPNKLDNGMGETNNYFYMPEGKPSESTLFRPRRGRLTQHRIAEKKGLFFQTRKVFLYQPEGDGPFPLMVVLDGQDYLQRGSIIEIVDYLIEAEKIKPLALALIPSTKSRFVDYACNDDVVSYIVDQVIPMAQNKLNLLDVIEKPGSYCITGDSMGGLMALYTALLFPNNFGKVISQAGAFRLNEQDYAVFDLVENNQPVPIAIWMDCGRFDFLTEVNQRMYALLQQKGFDVVFREMNGGHNFTSWRNDLASGIEHHFSLKY